MSLILMFLVLTVSPLHAQCYRQQQSGLTVSLCLMLLCLTTCSLHAQTTASECTLVALLAARARIMEGRPLSDTSRLVCYFSDQVSSSLLSRPAVHSAVTPLCCMPNVCLPRMSPTSTRGIPAALAVAPGIARRLLTAFP